MMSANAVLWSCLIAIIISIVISFKWKINLGLLAMSFAFIIGCLFMGEKVSKIFGYWPDSLIFFLIASGLFYGFATENGTIVALGNKLLWKFRKNLRIIPWAIFFISGIMAFLGAGIATIFFLSPVAYAIGATIGAHPLLMSVAVSFGYVVGTYNPWTGMGNVMVALISSNGVDTTASLKIATMVYVTAVVRNVFLMGVADVVFSLINRKKARGLKSREANEVAILPPADFTPAQRKTFMLIILSFVLILIPGMMTTWGHITNPVFGNISKFCQPQSIMVMFALAASVMRLADTKKVIAKLPVNTILMIAGVCFLMQIAQNSGLVEIIKGMFNDNTMPHYLIAAFITMIAGFLSLFSSTWSVVMPLMYPMVPALAAATGVNQVCLYTSIIMGSSCTTLCPFSTAGAQQIALAPDELKESMIPGLLGVTFVSFTLNALMAFFGLYNVFSI